MVSGRLMVSALLLLVVAGCHPLDDLMAGIFGRSMRDQPSIGPYEAPRAPAEGSVPFASGNFPAGPGVVNLGQPEGTAMPEPITAAQVIQALGNPAAFPAVTGLENPVPATAESLERGQVLFNRSCAPCHGVGGEGDGPVTELAPMFAIPINTDQSMGLNESYIYSIIRVGRGAMPAYGHQLTHYDRWHVVNYVLQLQGRTPGQQGAAGADTESSDN